MDGRAPILFSLVWSVLLSIWQKVALRTPHLSKFTSFYSLDHSFVTETLKQMKLLLATKVKTKAII